MLLSTEYGKLLKRDIGLFGLLFRPTIYGPYSFVRPETVTNTTTTTTITTAASPKGEPVFTADWASRIRSSGAYSQSVILCAGRLGLVYRVLQASIHDLRPWFNSPKPEAHKPLASHAGAHITLCGPSLQAASAGERRSLSP